MDEDKSKRLARLKKNIEHAKITMRDEYYGCKVGETIIIKNNQYLIAISNNNGIYLINKKNKFKYMDWDEWVGTKKEKAINGNRYFWGVKTIEKIKEKLEKIKRKSIVRTPVKKKKIIIRTPVKIKIIREPAIRR